MVKSNDPTKLFARSSDQSSASSPAQAASSDQLTAAVLAVSAGLLLPDTPSAVKQHRLFQPVFHFLTCCAGAELCQYGMKQGTFLCPSTAGTVQLAQLSHTLVPLSTVSSQDLNGGQVEHFYSCSAVCKSRASCIKQSS